MAQHGVGPMQTLKTMFMQMLPMVFFFFTLNRMSSAETAFEPFKTGGALWFTDLTAADPYLIFPGMAIVSMFLTLALNPNPKPLSTTVKVIFGALAIFSFWATSGFPAAVHIYWTAVNVLTVLTMLALRIPGVRQRLGIPLAVADSVKAEYNQLFDRPPAKAAAPKVVLVRPGGRRQQRADAAGDPENKQT